MFKRLLLPLTLLLISILPASAKELKIILGLDGIPLSLIEDAQKKEGLFREFQPPAPLISTFPAITEVMLTEMYGIAPPSGYGLRYYDEAENALKGGISDPEAISVWFNLYDYLTPMLDRGIVYVWARWGWKDIDMLERYLDRADSGLLLIHLDSTDAMMHHEKAEVTRRWLRQLDKTLSKWLAANTADTALEKREIELVMFSDHGNDLTKSRRVPIEKHLKKKGFRPKAVVDGESGVAILPTGLISTSYMYTPRKVDVARALVDMPGVDFSLYETGGVVFILNDSGTARVERDSSGERYRYVRKTADPLRLDTIVKAMAAAGKLDADGFGADADWFEATWDHDYPDALNRAFQGLTGHVENVGDVLLSLKNGWNCGSRWLSRIVRFHGTHGSMTRESITGFAISNRRELTPQRAEDLLDNLGWREEFGAVAARKKVDLREERAEP